MTPSELVTLAAGVVDHLRTDARRPWNAVGLLAGTAMAESGGTRVTQVHGPAVGLWQMEEQDHDDIWHNYLLHHHVLATNARTLSVIAFGRMGAQPGARQMRGNAYYACAMARVHYLRDKPPLPCWNNAPAVAQYWKLHYNTVEGDGTTEHFLGVYDGVMDAIRGQVDG